MGKYGNELDQINCVMTGKRKKGRKLETKEEGKKTRSDTRLPKSRAGGQGPYLRSLHHLGRSSEARNRKKPKKVKCDGPTDGRTDGPTDGPTKRGVESRSTRLKRQK